MRILTLILLLIPLQTGGNITSDLEKEIMQDNPGYYEWSYSQQEKVKEIYTKYHY